MVIDGGLHATEVLGAHQLMELVYEMVTRNDPDTMRLLNDVILLATPVNPDGQELVSSWYMREPVPATSGASPLLAQRGHGPGEGDAHGGVQGADGIVEDGVEQVFFFCEMT